MQLEQESDASIRAEICSTLESFVSLYGHTHPCRWLDMCRDIIVNAKLPLANQYSLEETKTSADNVSHTSSTNPPDLDMQFDEDEEKYGSVLSAGVSIHTSQCAARCINAIILAVSSNPDVQLLSLKAAKKSQLSSQQLVLRLQLLVNVLSLIQDLYFDRRQCHKDQCLVVPCQIGLL